jgi:threonine dehydrogenase-like Zn-dependent dehydrogenase
VGTITGTGRAAVVSAYGETLELRELPIPEPEPGALVVRIDRTTVCGSDVHIWQGMLAGVLPVELPLILGHEIVGEVVAIGAGAELDSVGRPVKLGSRVVWAHESCGQCRACTIDREPTLCATRRVGMLESCERPPYFTGGFSEFGYVWPRAGRLVVPDDVESTWAAAASCALRTVVNAFERVGRIAHTDTVVIQGAGPLGLFSTALAATQSPARLIVIGAPDTRLSVARAWGATDTVDLARASSPASRARAILDVTDGRGADVVFEVSGGAGAFAETLQIAAPGARCAIVGTVSGAPQEVTAHLITNRGLTIFGSFGGDIDAYWKALEFLRRHRKTFDWDLLFTRTYSLQDATEALERMSRFEEIKPIIDPWRS